MNLQVLVATINQTDHSIIEKMNIKTDCIIGNQTNFNRLEKFDYHNKSVLFLNFNEKGVGLNRNNALMRASADYCLFADDDMVYEDDYEQTVLEAFNALPDADVIIFNLFENIPHRYVIKHTHRVHFYNFLRYGTARVGIKLNSVRNAGIFFNQCFGGGTEHAHGEDNLFLANCLRNGLKIYAYPRYIATLTDNREPTWRRRYDEKYLEDQACLYRTLSRKFWKILCLQDSIRHSNLYEMRWVKAWKIMVKSEEKK